MRARQLRTVDRESADDRLTSATEKTTPVLSEYHRVSRWQARSLERLQRRRQREGQTEICKRTVSVFSALSKEKCSSRLDATSSVQYLPRSAFDEALVVTRSSLQSSTRASAR